MTKPSCASSSRKASTVPVIRSSSPGRNPTRGSAARWRRAPWSRSTGEGPPLRVVALLAHLVVDLLANARPALGHLPPPHGVRERAARSNTTQTMTLDQAAGLARAPLG